MGQTKIEHNGKRYFAAKDLVEAILQGFFFARKRREALILMQFAAVLDRLGLLSILGAAAQDGGQEFKQPTTVLLQSPPAAPGA